ncbi:MAG: S-ribosylhomocysteine lyase [Clostridia bacterium]|nr:S-ribosylhomocysteine lyase [Clostridia bacterium]
MKKIASFCVDHNKIIPGVYISRIDDDLTTFDIRMVKPNTEPFLDYPVIHSIEHLFATFARNSYAKDNVIYFGPMGCRTGFYFLVRNMKNKDALALIKDIFKDISCYKGQLPGCKKEECGNYLEQDLNGAIKASNTFYQVIKNLSEYNLDYNNL